MPVFFVIRQKRRGQVPHVVFAGSEASALPAFFEIRHINNNRQQITEIVIRRRIQRRSPGRLLRGGQEDNTHQNAFDSKRRGGGANDRDSKRPRV